MSRNFLRDDMNALHPQVDWRGAMQSGRVETGLELFAYLEAILSLAGGFNPKSPAAQCHALRRVSDDGLWVLATTMG